MILVGLVLLKFCVYFAVCIAAIPMLELGVADRTSFALRWSGFRLLLGLVLGILIAWLFGTATYANVPDVLAYSLSFVFVRYVAWLVVYVLIAKAHYIPIKVRGQWWVCLGVATNVALDGLAVVAGADRIRLWC